MTKQAALAILSTAVLLANPRGTAAQERTLDIQATGEYRMASGETAETGRAMALADARQKAVQAAVAALQGNAGVIELHLKPAHLHAYATVLLAELERPAETSGSATVPRSQLRFALTPVETTRWMLGLRRDQDATFELVEALARLERLHRQLADQSKRLASASRDQAAAISRERERTLTAIEVTRLTARAYAAFVRIEPATVGGSVSTAEGRARAQELARTALALDPESPEVLYLIGDLLIETEQPEEAEAAYRKGLLADSRSVPARTKLAAALRYQGRLEDAIAELREAQRIDGSYARAHSDLGMILRAQKKLPEAATAYRDAVRLDPDFIDARNGLAATLANGGNLEEAAREFREIVRIDPDSTIGYYNLAYVLADLDRDIESAAALREVIRINPNHYNARYNLGELFRLEQKFDESASQFREYLRLAPDTPQNRRNITRARGFINQFEDPNAPPVAPAMTR